MHTDIDYHIGTRAYACPAFLHAGAGRSGVIDLSTADACPAGVMLFELLTGCLPSALATDAPYKDYSSYYDRRAGNGSICPYIHAPR